MKKTIILTENDLTKIIKQVIQEQGFGGAAGIVGTPDQVNNKYIIPKYPCLPASNLYPFIYYIQKNKNKICSKLGITPELLLKLTKAAIGIMKRETDFGYSFKAAGENLIDWFDETFLSGALKKSGKFQSVGPAQFRTKTWEDLDMKKLFGMDINMLRTIVGSGMGTIVSVLGNYRRAMSLGYTNNSKSVNPFLAKKGIKFLSTGNAALDLSIVAHNQNIIKRYCYTSSPNLAGPCDQTTYTPYKKGTEEYNKYKTLKVYQNKQIINYFPNKGHKGATSIGYLEEVVKVMNSLNCVKI